MTIAKQNILGLSLTQIRELVQQVDEPQFRAEQVYQWLYARGARSFAEMSNLGKAFRERLENEACINGLTPVTQQHSATDATTKYLFQLTDGLRIESVLIPPSAAFQNKGASREDEQRRLTVCVSTQVGCPLDCKFCATATMGFVRNLTPGEIIDQIHQVTKLSGKEVTNVVFMGMGEPLMNYDNVLQAAGVMVNGMGIAARRITISTAGWADNIRRLAEEPLKVKLALSLHSVNDATRTALMPITKKYDLAALTSSLEYYYRRTKRRITYEYIFFDGVNDSDKDVQQLIRFARRIPSKINVIPYHSIASVAPRGFAATLKPSPRTAGIVETLRAHNLTVMVRSNAGEDIDAACGQLAVTNERKKRPPVQREQRDTRQHATPA